jgi:hypothetical protein
VDVLPTIAGFVHQPYLNTTLGRDLLRKDKANNFAFITNNQGRIGIITDDFYYTMNINLSDNEKEYKPNEQLHPVNGQSLLYSQIQQDSIKRKMGEVTTAIYETAKWMLMNNQH